MQHIQNSRCAEVETEAAGVRLAPGAEGQRLSRGQGAVGPAACVVTNVQHVLGLLSCGVCIAGEQPPASEVGQLSSCVAQDNGCLLACSRDWRHTLNDDVGRRLALTDSCTNLRGSSRRGVGSESRVGQKQEEVSTRRRGLVYKQLWHKATAAIESCMAARFAKK